jgi:hypothetical protein
MPACRFPIIHPGHIPYICFRHNIKPYRQDTGSVEGNTAVEKDGIPQNNEPHLDSEYNVLFIFI